MPVVSSLDKLVMKNATRENIFSPILLVNRWFYECICRWNQCIIHAAWLLHFKHAAFSCFVNGLKPQEAKRYLRSALPLSAILILPILGRSGRKKGWGASNCVNSSGNCVWPLTVSVIASLLPYFAWQSERLTPEGWRPGALRLTGRGLLKSLTCSPPSPGSSEPPLILFRVRGRVGGCSIQLRLRLRRLKPEGPLAHADGAISGCLPAPGQWAALPASSPLLQSITEPRFP